MTIVEQLRLVGPTLVAVFVHLVQRREVLTRPEVNVLIVVHAVTAGGEHQGIGVSTHEMGCPVVVFRTPVHQLGDNVAATVGGPAGHLYQRLLAAGTQLVARHQLQILVIVAVSLVELTVEAAHLSHIEIQLGLHVVVPCLNQAQVGVLRLGVVIHQSVAFANLEIDTILLRPIARHAVVGLLVAL